MKKKNIFILVLTLFTIRSLYSQTQWKYYTSGNAITDLAIYKNDLWVATRGNGLVKVNTLTGDTTVYLRTNSSIPNHRVNTLAIDTAGNVLLVLQYYGIVKFDGNSWTTLWPFYDNIYEIVVDSTNTLWLATDSGAYTLKDGTAAKLPGLPEDYIRTIAIDHNGNQWMGTGSKGLVKYKDNQVLQIYDFNNSPLQTLIQDIKFDAQGDLWAGCESHGLFKFDGTTWKNWNSINSTVFQGEIVDNLNFDSDQNLWIAASDGLYKFDGTTFTYCSEPGLDYPSNWTTDVVIDSRGHKWLGTANFGLFEYDDIKLTKHQIAYSGLQTSSSVVMKEDKNGKKWFGTNSEFFGIASLEGNTWISYNSKNSNYKAPYCMSIAFDNNGNTYSVTIDGLYKFDGTTWSYYPYPSPLWYGITDNNGMLLLVSNDGLVKFDGTNFSKVNGSNIGSSRITIDKKGNVWMPLGANGINKFDGNAYTNYNPSNSGIPPGEFLYVIADSSDNIWAGGSRGLTKFDGTKWAHYTPLNSPLPDSVILDITADKQSVWISTRSGLARFDGVKWTIYNEKNSPITSQITSITIDRDGNKWLAIMYGGFLLMKTDKVTGLNTFERMDTPVIIYPNPAQDAISINFKTEPNKRYSFSLADLNGKTAALIDNITTSGFKMNVEKLSKGMYIYKLTTGNEVVGTGKVVVQ